MRNLSGWKADTPDGRDYIKSFSFKASPKLPKKIDLRESMKPVPVSNQDALGSCTAQAWCDTLEYLAVKSGQPHTDLSRLFVYYCAREFDGNTQWDAGSTIRSGAKALAKVGAPIESLWPYVISEFATKPSEQAYANAPNQKLSRYERIPNLFSIKSVLSRGIPVVFGFAVYQSFEQASEGGHVPYPVLSGPGRESLLGGHAVVAVGYDNTKPYDGALIGRGCVICRNSWGPQWGECLAGDTQISLLNGQEATIEDLFHKGDAVWIYSYDTVKKKIVPRLARPKYSGIRSDLVKVTLDNGHSIICTKDHPWMLRDGSFAEALQLNRGQSLMPLYRKNHKVVSVEIINLSLPVYDLQVEGDHCHNFAISAGVFVHNSGYFYLPYPFFRRGLTADHWTAAQGTFT